MPKRPRPEDVFYDSIYTLINNMLIDNPNYVNHYYSNKSNYEIVNDTKERAKYILDKMKEYKHLLEEV